VNPYDELVQTGEPDIQPDITEQSFDILQDQLEKMLELSKQPGFPELTYRPTQARIDEQENDVKTYGSVKEFVSDLIDNEGVVFGDKYGRKWMYVNYQFIHKDLGDTSWDNGLFCLHLYGTGIEPEA
jgi:hypothetical protein